MTPCLKKHGAHTLLASPMVGKTWQSAFSLPHWLPLAHMWCPFFWSSSPLALTHPESATEIINQSPEILVDWLSFILHIFDLHFRGTAVMNTASFNLQAAACASNLTGWATCWSVLRFLTSQWQQDDKTSRGFKALGIWFTWSRDTRKPNHEKKKKNPVFWFLVLSCSDMSQDKMEEDI